MHWGKQEELQHMALFVLLSQTLVCTNKHIDYPGEMGENKVTMGAILRWVIRIASELPGV